MAALWFVERIVSLGAIGSAVTDVVTSIRPWVAPLAGQSL